MVLMKYLFFVFFLIFFNFKCIAESLTKEEKVYFNIIDFNNDDKISYQEADQIIKIIFKLLDVNQDNIITEDEIIELKNIIKKL